LESYHPYLQPQEVSKTPTTLGTYSSLPKIRKGHFGCLMSLGVYFFFKKQTNGFDEELINHGEIRILTPKITCGF
jgi:hypothetical protein